jgi:hypothetical protein
MNIKKKIKEELLEAAENTKGAEALVLLIGYEDDHSSSNLIGGAGNLLSMLTKAIDHILSDLPEPVGKDLRMKAAEILLRGEDDASE